MTAGARSAAVSQEVSCLPSPDLDLGLRPDSRWDSWVGASCPECGSPRPHIVNSQPALGGQPQGGDVNALHSLAQGPHSLQDLPLPLLDADLHSNPREHRGASGLGCPWGIPATRPWPAPLREAEGLGGLGTLDPPPPQDQGGVRGQAGRRTEERQAGGSWSPVGGAECSPHLHRRAGAPGQISCLCLSPQRRPFQGCGKGVLRRWGRRPHTG